MDWRQLTRDVAVVATAYNTWQTSRKLTSIGAALDEFKQQTSRELDTLTKSMERGFSILSMELALQSKTFRNILNVLKNKRKTEAEELKSFAITALRNGWVDDAIEDFQKSLSLNRYDYQVYFLLSKCHRLKNDLQKQDHYIQKAYQYSAEDPEFRQYVGLDIVSRLIDERKFEEARECISNLESLIERPVTSTPLNLAKLQLDIASDKFGENTLQCVDCAIENYEGSDPSKILTVLRAVATLLSDDRRIQLENRLNLKQLSITKKYGRITLAYLENIERILAFLHTTDDSSSILKTCPRIVLKKHAPELDKLAPFLQSLRALKERLTGISIDDYEKFQFIAPRFKDIEANILDSVRKVFAKSEEGNFNSNPFEQTLTPEVDFKVPDGDRILVQCKLSDNELITLTYFSLIITDKNKKTLSYDLVRDFSGVRKEELRSDEISAEDKKCDKITFYLRDELSEKIFLISSSGYYASSYGSREKYANVLNLLWSRAINNIIISLNLSSLNQNLEFLRLCIDFTASTRPGERSVSKSDEVGAGSLSEVEFIESSDVQAPEKQVVPARVESGGASVLIDEDLRRLSKLAKCTRFYVSPNIPDKIRASASREITKGAGDQILFVYDSTVFGSGADGIAITNRTLFIKEAFCKPEAINFLDINKASVDDTDLTVLYWNRERVSVEIEVSLSQSDEQGASKLAEYINWKKTNSE